MGNPSTEDYYDTKGVVEYAWSHSVISDQLFNNVTNACNFRMAQWGEKCNELMRQVFLQYDEIDIYNIYAPKCINPKGDNDGHNSRINYISEKMKMMRRIRIRSGYDPCFSKYAEEYFNRDDVKRSIHADNSAEKWKVCRWVK